MTDASARPLRLAIYLPDFVGGGVERVSLMLIDAFIAGGIDVQVIVHRDGGELRSLLPPAARLVALKAARTLTALPLLAAQLRRDPPDVLLSNLGHNNIVALWARAFAELTRPLSRRRTRIVICQHNALSAEAAGIGSWQHRVLPLLYRLFAQGADAIVGVSDGVSDDLARSIGLPRHRVVTLHNPVLDGHTVTRLKEPSMNAWMTDPSLRVVVGIGRLVPQKSFATLLQAFARLDRTDTRLVIAGDGPERMRLEALAFRLGIAHRLQFVGFVLSPLALLRDASVMVMSSAYEGFGNVLVEALAAGVPVVSTDCPHGPAEILADGRFGLLVPVGDVAAMSAAIARQLDAPFPTRAERQARAAEFHVDIVSQRYLQLFATLDRRAARHLHAPPPRKVLMYLPQRRVGGAELSMQRVGEDLAARGMSVVLAYHDPDFGLTQAIEAPAGVRLVPLAAGRSLQAVRELATLLRRERPDVLISALPHSNLAALAARWLAGVDCRVVISDHAPLSQQIKRTAGWRYRLLAPLARLGYVHADAAVAVSAGVRDDVARIVPAMTPARVVLNPVLPSDWRRRAATPVAHPWLNDGALEVVLSMSRLSREKDLPTLLQAFAHVAARRPNARLLVAGDGPEAGALQRLAKDLGLDDRIDWPGMVPQPLAWMKRARVFVLASQYEGFGNVLIEALAVGVPVVATDCPVGPREALAGGRLGALVPVGDADAMARAIKAAIAAGRPPAGAVQAAQAYTQQQRAGAAWLALIDELCLPPRAAAPC